MITIILNSEKIKLGFVAVIGLDIRIIKKYCNMSFNRKKTLLVAVVLLQFIISLGQNVHVADSLLAVYESNKDDMTNIDKASALSKIGSHYSVSQMYSKSIVYKKQALDLYREEKDVKNEIKILEQIGIIYSNICNYNSSLIHFFEALKLAEKANDLKLVHAINLNIGITYLEVENYDKGLEYLHRCQVYYEKDKTKNIGPLLVIYTDLGAIHQNLNQLDSAQIYCHKALSICKSTNNDGLGGVLINLGDLYTKLKKYDEALDYYNQGLVYFDQKKDLRGYWHSKYSIAHLNYCQKNYQEAIVQFEEVIDAFIKTDDLSYLSDSYLDLSKIYREIGKPEKALDYYIKYHETNEKISSSEILTQMAQLEMQYDLEKLEQKSKLEIEIINKEKQLISYRWYFIVGVMLIVLVILVSFMQRYKNRKKLVEVKLRNAELEQTNLEEEIKYSKKELESFALHIVHNNEFLQTIKKALHELKDNKDQETSQKIRELSFQITQSLRRNKDIEKLQERIDLVHSSFMKKLSNQFPQLTEKEKRLCVMLKLDLSSKEIAVLNNISENAVMMARYRMRKKMNMNSEENLVDFLQKIR